MSVDQPLESGGRLIQYPRVHPGVAVTEATLAEAADRARAFALGEGRACYAGLHIDHPARTLIVFRVPDGTFDRRLRDVLGPDIPLAFRTAAHSRVELEAARDRVWDLPEPEHIIGVSVPVDGSALKVTFDGDVPAAQAWMNITLPGLVAVAAVGEPSRR